MQREFIFTNKWLDLVFENRNQSYGAFVLRKNLHRNILIGYVAAIIFMSSVLFTMYQFSTISINHIKGLFDELPKQVIYEVKPVTPITPPQATTDSKITPTKPNTENLIPLVKDSAIDTETKDKKITSDLISVSQDTSGIGENGKENSSPVTESKNPAGPTEPFSSAVVDKIPEFPGGEPAMIRFIQKNTHVPFEYLDEEISKTVYISFVVDSTGNIYEIKAANTIDAYPKLADAARKTVTKMPNWIPGQQHGRNVAVRLTLPIKFSVKKD